MIDEPQSYGGNGAVWPTQQRYTNRFVICLFGLFQETTATTRFIEHAVWGSGHRTNVFGRTDRIVSLCAFKKGSSPCQRYRPNMRHTPKVRFSLINQMIWCFILKLAITPPYEERPGNVNSQRDMTSSFT